MTKLMASMQDVYLDALNAQQIPVSLYLVNGIRLQGTIESFDNYVVTLSGHAGLQQVYKHAISTMVPTRPLSS